MSSRVQVFRTSPVRIRYARINPMGLWVVAAMFAAGGFYYFFQNVAAGVRPSTRLVVLWATLIPSFIIFLVGAVQILLIPRRASDGWIEVGPYGLRYQIGRHRADYSWTDFIAVSDDVRLHGGWSVRGSSPSALLLAPPSGVPTSRFRRSNLHYFAERLRARVRRRYGVTLVPLTLFSREDAHEISAAARAAHAAARGERQTTGRTAGRRCASRAYSAARRPPSAGGSTGSSGWSAPAPPSGVQMISGDLTFAAARRSALSRATALSRPKDSPRSACIDR